MDGVSTVTREVGPELSGRRLRRDSCAQTCCVFKANGCSWKGKVADLASHHKVCTFAAAQCPYGCGRLVDQQHLRNHLKECDFRPVSDCPCGRTFRFNERVEHERACMQFLQASVPRLQAATEAANAKLVEHRCQMRELRADHVRDLAQVTPRTDLPHIGGHTVLYSALDTVARLRKGSKPACDHSRVQTTGHITSGVLLVLAIVATFGQLVRPDATLALALFLLAAVQSQAVDLVAPAPLLVLPSLAADVAWFVLIGPLAPYLIDTTGSAVSTGVSASAAGGIGRATGPALLELASPAYVLVGAVLKIVALLPHRALLGAYVALSSEIPQGAGDETLEGAARGIDLGPGPSALRWAAGWWPFSQAKAMGAQECAELWVGGLGYGLLILSAWTCICRPDSGAMLALLVLTALHDSRLYFSRVTLGAALLAICVDIVWLRFQALSELGVGELLAEVLSLRVLSRLGGQPLLLQMGVVGTLLSLPLKIALLLTAVHLLCLPHVAEQQHFRFETLDDVVCASSSGSLSSLVATGAPPKSVAQVMEDGHLAVTGGMRPEERAERRRLNRVIDSQLRVAKRIVSLSFLGMALASAVATLRMVRGLGATEPLVFTMVSAYGCLRHSKLCQSRPERCSGMLTTAAMLLVPAAAAAGLQTLAMDELSTPWSRMGVLGRAAVVVNASSVLLLLLLLGAVQQLRSYLVALTQSREPVEPGVHRRWCARVRALAEAGFALSLLLGAVRRDGDCAVFALALFSTTAEEEADAAATVAAVSSHSVAARLPGVGDRAEERLRAARMRHITCLAPDPQRRPGGLLSALLLLLVTSAVDLIWGMSERDAARSTFVERASLVVLGGKLAVKLVFALATTRLLSLRRTRPADGRDPHAGPSGPMFASSVALLLLACVSGGGLGAETSLRPRPALQSDTRGRAHLDVDELLAAQTVGLIATPAGVLAVLGCALALGSGGATGARLLSATSLLGLVAAATWLSSLGLDLAGLASLASGVLLTSTVNFSWQLQACSAVLLAQATLVGGIGVASAYRAVLDCAQRPRTPGGREA